MRRAEGSPERTALLGTLPKTTASQTSALQGTTPVPNVLLDTFLPNLSDTELRVLLVVDRATLGWKESNGRKESDWLSHRQLQARTGRAGASVSRAIEALVRQGLLVVQDGAGQARDSAHSRRATRGRLYYRLSEALLLPGHVQTLHCGQDEYPSPAVSPIPQSENQRGQAPSSTSPERLQKLKTTKETRTKEKELKMSSSKSEVELAHTTSKTSDGAAAKAGEIQSGAVENGLIDDLEEQVERFVTVFTNAYRLARPGETAPTIEEADRVRLRKYLKQLGLPVLEAWLSAFFSSSFGYTRRRGWSLGSYLDCLFILRAQAGSDPLRKGTWRRA